MWRSGRNMNCKLWTGVILCTLGSFLALVLSPIIQYFTKQTLVIRKSSLLYKDWVSPPIYMNMDFYFFNWTNPDNISFEKPAFVELGPYRYREKIQKVNVIFNSNSTVSYQYKKNWTFVPEESFGKEDDLITTVNIIAVTGAQKVLNKGLLTKIGMSILFRSTNQKLSMTRSVNELLFDGYTDGLIKIGNNLPGASTLGADKFGWFYGRNNSKKHDGNYNVNTGAQNINDIGIIKRWNFDKKTKNYPGKCAELKGSAGDQYMPGIRRHQSIALFSPDICRSIDLSYVEDSNVLRIPVYKFSINPDIFDNGTRIKGNDCFCDGDCVPSGLLNISRCRKGFPGFISLPHFLHADPVYLKNVKGLKPDLEKHDFTTSVEPMTGFPLEGSMRVQINVRLQPNSHVEILKDVPDVTVPLLWINHSFKISEEIGQMLRILTLLPSIGYAVSAVIFFFGIAVIYLTFRSTKERKKVLLNPASSVTFSPTKNDDPMYNTTPQ